MSDRYDLVVVGAGSGGIGAALAAARLGASVLLVERADTLGGAAVRGGVHCWEMGVGGTGIPFDIYRRLRRIPEAVGIYSIGRHCLWPGPEEDRPFPGGESVIDASRTYLDSLRRHGARSMREDEEFVREHWHGVVFEPDAYCQVVEDMLAETGNCTVLKGTTFTDVAMDGPAIAAIALSDGRQVTASHYVDSTGDMHLSVACGCRAMIGQEGKEDFGEPDAPDEANERLNGVTLIYRVTPRDDPQVEPLPPDVPDECCWRSRFPGAAINHYPGGDLNVNMLPTMEGREAFDLGGERAYAECHRRVLAHWYHNQTVFPELQGYRLKWVAPTLGVRETRRVVGRYVLTEHDVLAGLDGQVHDDIIAIADHAMDTHGPSTGRAGCGELKQPYGIPYRCLLAADVGNLLLAGRGASFTSLAASSCRLSRTMMQLGQAAGTASVLAKQLRAPLADVPPADLRQALVEQHVQLEWSMPAELCGYLTEEN